MCGRYALFHSYADIAKYFPFHLVIDDEEMDARYNAAPTQELPVITAGGHMGRFRWGLVPFWAKDISIGNRMINARAETLMEKPSFKTAFLKRRCIVPVSGFYEWKAAAKGKRPFFIHPKDEKIFAVAGLWDEWHDPESGDTVRSFTIITTEPNALMEDIHNRMPAVLRPEDQELWLSQSAGPEELLHALRPYPASKMAAHEVSTAVNSPRNDDATLIEKSEA